MADQLVFLIDGGAVTGPPMELLENGSERVRRFLEAERIELPATPLAGAAS
jgi:hypothetical protein